MIDTLVNEVYAFFNFGNGILHNFALSGSTSNWISSSAVNTGSSCNTELLLNVMIEGYFDGLNSMRTVLYDLGMSDNPNATDSIEVQLRDPITLNVVSSTNTILMKNGLSTCSFPPYTGSFYLVVKHRNAIETWSANPVNLEATGYYGFTLGQEKAYGNNLVHMSTGFWAIYSGDVNQDGSIDAFDFLLMEPDIVNGLFGYYSTDVNGDANVDAFDYLLLDPNIVSGIGVIAP